MDQKEFVSELSKLRPSSTFLVLHKYRNEQNELSDFNICFHISYENALLKSLRIVEQFSPQTDLQKQAQKELVESFTKSLDKIKTTAIEDIDDSYHRFFDENGEYIKGVKLHTPSNVLHIYGLVHLKRILEPVVYKKVNHRPLTIEKMRIQRSCPTSRFRQFRIHPSQLEKIRVEHLSLLPPEVQE